MKDATKIPLPCDADAYDSLKASASASPLQDADENDTQYPLSVFSNSSLFQMTVYHTFFFTVMQKF